MPDIYDEIELVEAGHADLIGRLKIERKSLLSKLDKVNAILEKLTGKSGGGSDGGGIRPAGREVPNGLKPDDGRLVDNGLAVKRGKRKMSAAHRQAIIAAQKARWAKVKGASSAPKEKTAKKKGGIRPNSGGQ